MSFLALWHELVSFFMMATRRYLVWSGLSVYGGYVYHARFLVQSNDRSPGYLEERVEAFIAGFREVRRKI